MVKPRDSTVPTLYQRVADRQTDTALVAVCALHAAAHKNQQTFR